MSILVTGGAGYIGSHTIVELLDKGEEVVAIDNLCNSSIDAIESIKKITNKDFYFYKDDIRDEKALNKIFSKHKISSVIHFAGLKAVGESVKKPLLYYHNNVLGTVTLLDCMKNAGVKDIVFSSSATVYGAGKSPLKENMKTVAVSPYGATKKMIEDILIDLSKAGEIRAVLLRYFNPIGAHSSGLIGENPFGIPNNLMPFICKVANKELPFLNIFGSDYPTADGTAIRDYIHITDLAVGHILALEKLKNKKAQNLFIFNLGTGTGKSVLEVVNTFIASTKAAVPYKLAPRREGDVVECFASTEKAKKELGFIAKHSLSDMCISHYTASKFLAGVQKRL